MREGGRERRALACAQKAGSMRCSHECLIKGGKRQHMPIHLGSLSPPWGLGSDHVLVVLVLVVDLKDLGNNTFSTCSTCVCVCVCVCTNVRVGLELIFLAFFNLSHGKEERGEGRNDHTTRAK